MPLTPPIPPVPSSPESRNLVRRTFEREVDADTLAAGGEGADRAQLQAAERLSARLLERLAGWFGAAGTLALASRALARVQQEQKLLVAVRLSSKGARLRGVEEAAADHGATATVDGVLAMLATLTDAMGRLLSTELAAHIFAQCALPDHPTANGSTTPLPPRRPTTDD